MLGNSSSKGCSRLHGISSSLNTLCQCLCCKNSICYQGNCIVSNESSYNRPNDRFNPTPIVIHKPRNRSKGCKSSSCKGSKGCNCTNCPINKIIELICVHNLIDFLKNWLKFHKGLILDGLPYLPNSLRHRFKLSICFISNTKHCILYNIC